MTRSRPVFTANPTDFTFTAACQLCLWLKLKHGQRPPWKRRRGWNVPSNDVTDWVLDQRLEDLSPRLPPGEWERIGEVKTEPLEIPSRRARARVCGRPRYIAAFDDGTFGLYRVKLGDARTEHAGRFDVEVNAYVRAAEKASPPERGRRPITRMGVFYVPRGVRQLIPSAVRELIQLDEVMRDDRGLDDRLDEFADVFLRAEPPAPDPRCPHPHQFP